jgi:hypothetical protein
MKTSTSSACLAVLSFAAILVLAPLPVSRGAEVVSCTSHDATPGDEPSGPYTLGDDVQHQFESFFTFTKESPTGSAQAMAIASQYDYDPQDNQIWLGQYWEYADWQDGQSGYRYADPAGGGVVTNISPAGDWDYRLRFYWGQTQPEQTHHFLEEVTLCSFTVESPPPPECP